MSQSGREFWFMDQSWETTCWESIREPREHDSKMDRNKNDQVAGKNTLKISSESQLSGTP